MPRGGGVPASGAVVKLRATSRAASRALGEQPKSTAVQAGGIAARTLRDARRGLQDRGGAHGAEP